MCLNMHIFTYYRSKRENVIFYSLNFCYSQNHEKCLWLQRNLEHLLYQVLWINGCKRCGGHDALDLIRLKWQNFRFQILLRQNVANYVYVTLHVLKCAYLYLISLKAHKCDFSILWFFVILWIVQKVCDFKGIWKACCIKCCRYAASSAVAAMMH